MEELLSEVAVKFRERNNRLAVLVYPTELV